MTSVRTLAEAEDELGEAAAYYEARRPGLGVEFILAVDDGLMTIAERPVAYPLWRDDRPYRKYVLRRFPYTVFNLHESEVDSIRVIAVAHNKRQPGYWLSRVVEQP